MSGKFKNQSDFTLPNVLADVHEWLGDALIDDFTGQDCKLIFQAIHTPCENCYINPQTGRSSGVYKPGGPIVFITGQTCPYCQGKGKTTQNPTDTIRLRVYWRQQDWFKVTPNINTGDSLIQVIGYMSDLPKFERAIEIVVNDNLSGLREWRCTRYGEAVPHGFRQNRYFIQFLKRIGGN